MRSFKAFLGFQRDLENLSGVYEKPPEISGWLSGGGVYLKASKDFLVFQRSSDGFSRLQEMSTGVPGRF